ncbi:sugar ABC transporter ATP-binding protein [Marmoricola sp. URHB0036]|uniref:sugar ABC transporter ATP-binding protein n=1 Tax=Marmoricola sp. URHB0036 TaxID=1298863 RepID=UPI0004009345|nr:sugar ABC transporter ATP-binding protein [Marmoricola sp. URHB0036]
MRTQLPGSALAMVGACKTFGANKAVDDVSFELAPGRVHALLGGNGSGKSTLIKLLAGVERADAGRVEIAGRVTQLAELTPARAGAMGLRFVHQQRSTFPELTVAENLAIGGSGFPLGSGGRIRWREARRRAEHALERFGIEVHPDQLLGELGPARQAMVAIARALQSQGEGEGVLILDEPTVSLPDAEVRLLLDAVRRHADRGQTVVLVTHRLEEVFAVADNAILLRNGRLVDEVSPQSITRADLIELVIGRPVEEVAPTGGAGGGPAVLEVHALQAGPVGPVDLTLHRGEVVGIAGLVGSGRSSLLKALFGVLPAEAGEVRLDGQPLELSSPRRAMRAGFALVPESRAEDAAFPDLTLTENLSVSVLPDYFRGGLMRGRRERRDANGLLTTYAIKAEAVEDPLDSLSGGNQQKAVVARWLRREPRVVLLDEPTQGVDVGARAEIYGLIKRAVDTGSVALVASSDSEELAAICDRVLVLRRGRIVGEVRRDQMTSNRIERLAHGEAEEVAV